MKKYINDLPNEYQDQLNLEIMKKAYDKPLVEYIYDALKGYEILPNIKILDYTWDDNENNYDINDHVIRRNSNRNKAVKNIADTRCGVMYVNIEVSGPNKNGEWETQQFVKPIILPLQDKNGYYLIKGKKCYLIYQMVDKMLYPSFGAVTIKSLMPICVKTNQEKFIDLDNNEYTIPVYTIQIFKNAINVLLIYSHIATDKMLQFLEVDRFIKIENKDNMEKDDEYIRFSCGKKSDIIVAVNKDIFDKEIYVKSITGCLVKLFTDNKIQYKDINNWKNWMVIVGNKNTIRRGEYQHIFFNRLLDDVTRKELKINEYDKQNIYYLLRWILQNYQALWSKDNLSLENKRLRCNEYIGSFVTAEVSKRINRIVSLGDKATLRDYMNLFKFPRDIFITRLHKSGVLRYIDNVSDLDMAHFFKYTKKGPNSLGNNDARRIPTRQRELHPSFLGVIDVADTSSSDPGQSGSLSPYCNVKSMYFDDSNYENELHFRISKYLREHPLDDEYEEFHIQCDSEEEYNSILDLLFKEAENKFKIFGVSSNPMELIIAKDPRESYRKFDEKHLMEESTDK